MYIVKVKYWHGPDLEKSENGPFGTRDTAEKFALMVAEFEDTAEVQIVDTFKDKENT